ncbi:4722_t:CDS:2 [Rhizophagus irregularis]|nr:4722_t:CDS:2 [Rhizophagus irregularis]
MIFNYSPNIKKLIIFSDYVDQELCNIPELRKCFLNVTTLKCYTFVKLDKLAQISQKNLKYFKCGFKASYEISCKGIGEALTKQADSILLIHLSCPIKFCCPIFTKFVNLKTLKINGKIVDKSLMKPNLPNLEYLELYGGYIYEAAIFIKSTKGIALFYQDDHLVIRELEKLFSTCSQLERLVIVCEDYYNDSYDKLLDTRWKDKHQTSISVYYILYFKEIHKVDIINDCVEVKKFDDNYCCRANSTLDPIGTWSEN